jgi:hypothetical protein
MLTMVEGPFLGAFGKMFPFELLSHCLRPLRRSFLNTCTVLMEEPAYCAKYSTALTALLTWTRIAPYLMALSSAQYIGY